MRTLLVILATIALAGAAAGGAPECSPEVTLETPAGTYYVDNDLCQPDCLFSVWVYEESNGVEGCNEGDSVVL